MGIVELFLIAVGLSMDAFAVSVCKGLAMRRCTWKKGVIVGLYFGGFQALMPLLGYALGVQFKEVITSIDHWIAFILLGLIGLNMVREALGDCETDEEEEESLDVRTMLGLAIATSIDALAVGVTFAFLQVQIVPALGDCETDEEEEESLDVRTMLGLAIATSIDALAVGVTFAFLQVQIVPAVCFIGGITFTLSVAGVKIGNIFGTKYKSKAELAGGVILFLMGCKILLEHLGILH